MQSIKFRWTSICESKRRLHSFSTSCNM